jgi:hypothetical protein
VTPDIQAAVEGVTALASGVVLMLVAVALLLMRNVSQTARCRWCEHCRRADDDERERRAATRHQAYHQLTDQARATACQRNDCPGRE